MLILTHLSRLSINGARAALSWVFLGLILLMGAGLGAGTALLWVTPQISRQAKELQSCVEAEAARLKAEKDETIQRTITTLGVRDAKSSADQKDHHAIRERVIWRTKYVQNPEALRCNTDQWLRLHDAAALGAAPGDLTELSPDGISPVADAEILDIVTRNYDTYRQVARERDACRAELASAYGQQIMP